MPPQYQQPVLPPQGPVFQNPYLPPGQVQPPPRRSHKRLIFTLVLLLLLAGGGAGYYFLFAKNKPAPAETAPLTGNTKQQTTDNMHVGPYYYASACNAFTSEDFANATHRTADDSTISTEFATNTYPDTQKNAPLASTCGRIEAATTDDSGPLGIDVTMYEYPNTAAMHERLGLLGLDNAKTDADLGVRADYDEPSLTMVVGNKVVSVLLQGYGDLSSDDMKTMVYAAAGSIADRLQAKDQKSLFKLDYPATVTAPAFTYHNACSLWGAADFTKLYAKADESSIQMHYATAITEQQQTVSIDKSTKTTCSLGTTDAALTSKDYAYVEVDYYPTPELAAAGYDSHTGGEGATDVSGIGDKAFYSGDQLTVLSGHTLIRTQFKPHTGKAADQAKVTSMARTLLARLQ